MSAKQPKSAPVPKGKKAGLSLGVSRVERCLRKAKVAKNVGASASIFTTALIEEVVEDVLKRAAEHAQLKKSKRVAVTHLVSAVRSDPDTAMLLCNFGFGSANDVPKAIDLILDQKAQKARKAKSKSANSQTQGAGGDLVDN
jgi:histone H3/H4